MHTAWPRPTHHSLTWAALQSWQDTLQAQLCVSKFCSPENETRGRRRWRELERVDNSLLMHTNILYTVFATCVFASVCPSVRRPSVRLSLCPSSSPYVRLSVCLSVCPSVSPSMPSFHLSIIHRSFQLSICLSFVCLSAFCLSVCLSVFLSVFLLCLSVCFSVCRSVCHSVRQFRLSFCPVFWPSFCP